MSVIDLLNKLLGDPNERELKKLWPTARRISELARSQKMQSLTLEDFPKKTEEFKKLMEENSAAS